MDNIATLLFNVVLSFVFLLLKIILLPIDLLIVQFLPDISNALTAVGDLMGTIASGLGWALSASGIPFAAIALISSYYIFKLTLPLSFWLVKLAIKWVNALKP